MHIISWTQQESSKKTFLKCYIVFFYTPNLWQFGEWNFYTEVWDARCSIRLTRKYEVWYLILSYLQSKSQPITLSWMLAKDMKLLGQRQKNVLVIALASVSMFASSPLLPSAVGQYGPDRCCTHSRYTLQLRNTELFNLPLL